MSLYVTEETARRYATEEITYDMIKGMHGQHLHVNKDAVAVCPGCPDCSWCNCPVPFSEHERTKPFATDHKNESDS